MFKVCSYNLGSNINDYQALCNYASPDFTIKNVDEYHQLLEKYKSVESKTAALVLSGIDALCLQETIDVERPFCAVLKQHDYHLFHAPLKYPDCIVVLNPKLFSNIVNYSDQLGEGDFACVSALHTLTKTEVLFASIHVPGCTLDEPITLEATELGDRHCLQVLEKIDTLSNVSLTIIGADMNVNPEKWSKRFQHFENKGFTTTRTRQITNVFPKSLQYKERELDFFLFKSPKKSTFLSFQNRRELFSLEVEHHSDLKMSPEMNFSDHLPIFASVHQK